jgi:uncharacterized membrane protein
MARHPHWVRRHLSDDDLDAIAGAVAAAERLTSGQVRVHLEQRCAGDPLVRARRSFAQIGMDRTRLRNGVLLYLALDDHRFAVLGDSGIHERVGAGFWDSVRDALRRDLQAGRMRDGIVAAVLEIGRALGEHFPDRPDDTNELSDAVSLGS